MLLLPMLGREQTQLTDFAQLWRRRYFEMTSSTLHLYKSDKDTAHAVDSIGLKGRFKSLESQAEELMAIPHSFKLVPKDYDDEPVLFYCDDEVSRTAWQVEERD